MMKSALILLLTKKVRPNENRRAESTIERTVVPCDVLLRTWVSYLYVMFICVII